jgi:hypothetical protein
MNKHRKGFLKVESECSALSAELSAHKNTLKKVWLID